MKSHPNHRGARAFSRIELMVVVVVFAIIAAVILLGMAHGRDRARRINCVSQLKSFTMGLRLFANDAGDYPFKLLANATNVPPGLAPFSTNNAADLWKLFEVAANDISTPRILICPGDLARRTANSFGTNGAPDEFSHTNNRLNALSYFLSLNADEAQSGNILAGDRYLTTDPESSSEKETRFIFGQQDFSQGGGLDQKVCWISTVHQGGGNAGFMDGSAQQLTTAKLRESITNQPVGRINRIWLPNTDATGRGNP